MADPPTNNAVHNADRARFWSRLSLWLAGYGVIVVTWGVYNAWPVGLSLCLLFFPTHLAAAGWLYRKHQFTFEVPAHVSEWDSLIAFLILALGVASGLVLLLAVGWVGVGAVYLRPARERIAWDEWFKLPVLFLLSFPLALDLTGSRHDWLRWINFGGLDPGWATTDSAGLLPMQIWLRLSFYGFALWLPGVAFWICLPALPLALIGSSQLAWRLGAGSGLAPPAAGVLAVFLNLLAIGGLVWLGRRWLASQPSVVAQWNKVADWARIRSRAPWLAALVIVLQQSSLVEGWLAGSRLRLNTRGAALLLLVLVIVRWRTGAGAIHRNTRILLGLSLFVLLGAEWTDFDPLRHLSLGILLITIISWRRAWGWWLLGAALFTWTTTIPGMVAWLAQAGLNERAAGIGKYGLFFLGLLAVVVGAWRVPAPLGYEAFDDAGWQPAKRFAFIMLCLVTGFQLASACWPLPPDQRAPEVHLTPEFVAATRASASTILADATRARKLRIQWRGQELDLQVIHPTRIPVRIHSPEAALGSDGWRVLSRRLVPQLHGQVVALQLARSGQTGSALYWFENGDRAFVDYWHARRILWSGWNLTHRDLRSVRVLAPTEPNPDRLIGFAESQNWFHDPGEVPESNQVSFTRIELNRWTFPGRARRLVKSIIAAARPSIPVDGPPSPGPTT